MVNLIEMHNVSKTYAGTQALKNVDFAFERGVNHCLVGENGSGKSTLIKIMSGVVRPDPGAEIFFDGKMCQYLDAKSSLALGVRVIYQDLALFPNLTVKENIAFQLYGEKRMPFVNWREVTKRARAAMAALDLDLDLDRITGTLSIAEQQLVEIARSMISELKLLILDEPTASLTRKEVNALFKALGLLHERGVTMLFVSHKLNEVFEIAEKVSVLRDGNKVGEYLPGELDDEKLVYLMTGHQLTAEVPKPLKKGSGELLRVSSLSKAGNYRDISFNLMRGEILGITGLLGSGRTELALSIFGMNKPDSGDIYIEGKKAKINSNTAARALGIGLVPENRLTQGLVVQQSILDNLSLTVLDKLLNRGSLIDVGRRQEEANKWVNELSIKTASTDAAVKTLSGGNQQKIVLSKWLATEPKVLILDEPTVGIDVLAKSGVYELVKRLAEGGMGIILISDEIQEVLSNCHRVLVMQSGRIVHEFVPGKDSKKELLDRFNLS
jgi:simple sugar transport system ATP-binding protein